MSQDLEDQLADPVQESQSFVRDPRGDNEQIVADKAYDDYLQEYHPDYQTKVYRVPFTSIFSPPTGKRISGFDNLHMMNSDPDHIRGDNAEKLVADSFERMLRKTNRPSFIITNYKLKNYCNKTNEPPPSDKNVYCGNGEHDILIISYDHGIIFVQVKAFEKGSDPEKVWKKAKEQTDEDRDFFTDNFQSPYLNTKSVIAFPNLDNQTLQREYKNLYEDHIVNYDKDKLLEYLLSDHLSGSNEDTKKEENLEQWWERSTRLSTGFENIDDYKRVVARYIGRKSTMTVRSPCECIAQLGNRYMNILLTPQQVAILTSGLRKLIIRGQYGAGKTTMLILKIRRILPQPVCIISMTKSPLIHVVEQSVKHDMDPGRFSELWTVNVADRKELKLRLEECKEKHNVFIDEVQSSLYEDESLSKLIKDFPSDRLIWAVMSSETGDDLGENLQKVFDVNDPEDPDRFRVAVLNKVLRCPPSIYPRPTPIPLFVDSFKMNIQNVSEFFVSCGLVTNKMPQHDNQPRYKWSDVCVVDVSSTDTELHSMLKDACVPLHYFRNISDARGDQSFENARKGAHGRQVALYVQHLPNNYPVNENLAAYIKGGRIYAPTVKEPKDLDTQDELEDFLTQSEIDTLKLKQKLLSDATKKALSKFIFVDKPKWYRFLEDLGIPLVTPYDMNKVLTDNAVLYTDQENREGFLESRKLVLRFMNETVTVNDEVVSKEGPSPIHVDHTRHGDTEEINNCEDCHTIFNDILTYLGLQTIPNLKSSPSGSTAIQPEEASEDRYGRNVMSQHRNPRHRLHWSDVIILDDRSRPNWDDVAGLLQKLVPVKVILPPDLPEEEHAFGFSSQVLYTTPENFLGLERKVVVVVVDNHDNSDLARSRCSSQLIILKTNKDSQMPPGTNISAEGRTYIYDREGLLDDPALQDCL